MASNNEDVVEDEGQPVPGEESSDAPTRVDKRVKYNDEARQQMMVWYSDDGLSFEQIADRVHEQGWDQGTRLTRSTLHLIRKDMGVPVRPRDAGQRIGIVELQAKYDAVLAMLETMRQELDDVKSQLESSKGVDKA